MAREGAKQSLIRSEVGEILTWLRDTKEVTGIYELSIRDSCYLPHTENHIRASLSSFDVEVLDWRRLDLSLWVLSADRTHQNLTCPNLKALRLYASGWPALAFWTSHEGLSFLDGFEKLTQVRISIIKEFVGGFLHENYRKEAETRFQSFRKTHLNTKLQVVVDCLSWASVNPVQEKRKSRPSTTAVEVTRLRPFLEAYESLHRDFAMHHWRDATLRYGLDEKLHHTPYVKVAVIDNGIDPGSIDCHSIGGASFVPSETGESNWWHIKHTHGTKMARIITELNPHCRLLVAKVCELRSDFTASRLVKAIDWAVAAGADVISMSLTLDNDNNNVHLAVTKARNLGIVVMASVHGEGSNSTRAGYPAGYKETFAVGSADRQGAPSSGTVEETVAFLFQGERIVANTEQLGDLEDSPDISGPSAATAIAAGVASLVLACDRFALHSQASTENENDWHRHRVMRVNTIDKVFKLMADKKYIRPWEFFAERVSGPMWGEGDSVLKWIVEEFKV